jgi:amidohydrolase
MDGWIDNNFQRFVEIRRYIHRHPELGFEEHQTAEYLKNLLRQSGYEIISNDKMRTGFCCEYGNGSGQKIGIRADLDALPISDTKKVDYCSNNERLMHACGHDVHMTIATGTALWLKENEIKIPGTVRFIFQPAEEKAPGGALTMIEAGAVDDLDNLIGMHVLPRMFSSKIGVKYGPMSAAVSLIEITLNGPGGHTSRPHETVDLISVTIELIQRLKQCIRNLKKPDSPFVLGLGQIEGGHTFNVIPANIILRGSIRYLNVKMKETLHQCLKEAIFILGKESGAKIDINIPYAVPTVFNDKNITDTIIKAANKAIGEANVEVMEKASMGSDDFGFYTDKLPCSFIRIGSSNGKVRDLHVSDFDVDENCIRTGLKVLATTISDYFKNKNNKPLSISTKRLM